MRIPAAEVDITEGLVRDLVSSQHPDLLGDLVPLANGWDNVVYRLGRDLTVRLPRRAAAAPLVEHELRWLPVLAPRLDLPVPAPVRTGSPSDGFPWCWSINPWYAGRALAHRPVPERRRHAATLGRFFAQLHRAAPLDAPANPVRGVPLARRSALFAEHLDLELTADRERLEWLWERSVAVPGWPGEPVWVHGDPHPANVLVHRGELTAVIDFGDLTAGDPATDLAMAWLAFDRAGRDRFAAAYAGTGRLDPDTWARARGWALSLGLSLLANSDDEPTLAAVGRHALAQVLQD